MPILHIYKKSNYMPGRKVKILRLQHNLTQCQLAEKAATTQSVISRLEKNEEYADVGLLKRLAEVFAVELGVFFDDTFVLHRREEQVLPPPRYTSC
jgi:transcriptional regulator with XRE-family HTH domain